MTVASVESVDLGEPVVALGPAGNRLLTKRDARYNLWSIAGEKLGEAPATEGAVGVAIDDVWGGDDTLIAEWGTEAGQTVLWERDSLDARPSATQVEPPNGTVRFQRDDEGLFFPQVEKPLDGDFGIEPWVALADHDDLRLLEHQGGRFVVGWSPEAGRWTALCLPAGWQGLTPIAAMQAGMPEEQRARFFDLAAEPCVDFAAVDGATVACLRADGGVSLWRADGAILSVDRPPCGQRPQGIVGDERHGGLLLHGCCADHVWRLKAEAGVYERIEVPGIGIGVVGAGLGGKVLVHGDGRIHRLS